MAVGTGHALRLGERGDVDAVLVHDRPSELAFVAEGHGIARREVMYNDFLVIGPSADPARVRGIGDTAAAWTMLERVRDVKLGAGITSLVVWPFFDPLRDDPRFEDLLARIGYPK